MLKGAADGHVGKTDGDGAESTGIELWVSLHDIERALGGEGVVVAVDSRDDFAFFCVGVRGDGEVWAFGGSVDGFWGQCSGERNGGWIDEGEGRGSKFCLNGVPRGGGWDVVDRGEGFSGRGHVEVV